jgi:hypothetical protein
MHDNLIISSIHNMASLMNRKVLEKVHSIGVPVFIHVAKKIIYSDTI